MGRASAGSQVPCSSPCDVLLIVCFAVTHGPLGQLWVWWPVPGAEHPWAWVGPGSRSFSANPTVKVKWLEENH